MNQKRSEIVAWVATQVLPHEMDVRRWLRRILDGSAGAIEVDDVIQETYCHLAALKDVSAIKSARAYFFQAARNVVLEQVRRARVVQFEAVAEMDSLQIAYEGASPERTTGARQELLRVQRLIAALPGKCRRIFELRKVHDLPQREIARQLRISENVVEKQIARGLAFITTALAEDDPEQTDRLQEARHHDPRNRTDHRRPGR